MINVGIIGATGYAGQQLVWILSKHPDVKIKFLCSHSYAETPYSEVYFNYHEIMQDLCISMQEAEKKLSEIDVLFTALPHGKSFDIIKKAIDANIKVIDLGSDFRLKSAESYKEWYGIDHGCPELLEKVVYGLPELNRNEIKNATLISNPGCYPTASILALSPLLKSKVIDSASIIIDAKSGVSGAGRSAKIPSLYCECNDSIKAYGVACHRHTPEIEQELSDVYGNNLFLTFTPHLTPMNRGILATCYAKLLNKTSEDELYNIYNDFYKNEYFVKLTNDSPETRWVRGSNLCHIGLKIDERTGRVIVISAIDNLIKGSAGQATQNMNIMFGLKETTGLEFISMAL